jgi:RHS repeat-associated protein
LEPFGFSTPDEDLSGLGTFDLPHDYPRQYFEKGTNLHYNYFRDYDSAIGRYVQSDPIGLDGGLNTYAYVDSAPLSATDPLGLVKWKGTVFFRGAGPAAFDIYTLTSECKCGVSYVVRVRTTAAGLTRGAAWAGQLVEFQDPFDCPDPYMLSGDYFNVGLAVSGGLGVGFAAGAGAVLGRSRIEWIIKVPCCPK